MDFSGKVALVTGGASGIGRACSIGFGQRGAKVAVLDMNEAGAQNVAEEITKQGGDAQGFQLDVSDVSQIQEKIERVLELYGQIDILVNCAGIAQETPVDELTEKDWDKMMAINLKGTFFVSQAVLKHMKERRYGKIVNMGSVAGEVGGIVVGANYAASKAGVICLTKSLAKSLGAFGINVNTVSPGFIATNMTTEMKQDVNLVPLLKRKGTPEEVAEPIMFLCSEYARYITGANLDINGGLQMN